MMKVEIDFFEDVRRDFLAALSRLGVSLAAETEVHPVVVEFFHLQRRLVPARPRQVLWSKQLRARSLNDDQRRAVETIATELTNGVDVTRRMTKSIRDAGYNDGLLTDWGVHHLHIGDTVLDDGFVKRGGPLLFVFITRTAAHLLDLLGHGSFEDDDLFEIIHENWPEVIASEIAPGVVPGSLSPAWGPEGRKQMRRKFVVATQTKDGRIYLPPGGGVATSGHSWLAVGQANALLNLVHPAEVWVREHADWIRAQTEQVTGAPPEELHMQFQTWLTLRLGQAVVCETKARALFHPVPPREGTEPTVGTISIAVG